MPVQCIINKEYRYNFNQVCEDTLFSLGDPNLLCKLRPNDVLLLVTVKDNIHLREYGVMVS